MAKSQENMQDQRATMETNSYSIVSKRSVEKLYLYDEPAFLQPFVSNYKRRAPLINRGYWLRMKAIETVVQSFLRQTSSRKKLVVNLGCGYDPLPFRMLHRGMSPEVLFVDVDYLELIQRKVNVIMKTPSFTKAIGPDARIVESDEGPIALRSASYMAVGADLADIETLDKVFNTLLEIRDHDILFVAEVSITYMTLEGADRLIRWTSSFEHARFCVLEQFLPDGPDHPFAKTMLDHFAKQQAPIQSVMKYHSLDQHQARFRDAGWTNVNARSLWDYWEDPMSLSLREKLFLDTIEPFDEWEEFILFSSHYFLLVANNDPSATAQIAPEKESSHANVTSTNYNHELRLDRHQITDTTTVRRYGRSAIVSDGTAIVLGGITNSSEMEVYTSTGPPNISFPPNRSISGHTLTIVRKGLLLMVGGRTSPANAKSECFTYDCELDLWTKVADIKPGRYRHCAVSVVVNSTLGILVHGGVASDGSVLGDWQLWLPDHGWTSLAVTKADASGDTTVKLFGATMLALNNSSGILLGGLNERKSISDTTLQWRLELKDNTHRHENQKSEIVLRLSVRREAVGLQRTRARFGAALVDSHIGPLLIGGVARSPLAMDEEILALNAEMDEQRIQFLSEQNRPLLLGLSVIGMPNGDVLLSGGGAVCFSFGQCVNKEWYHIRRADPEEPNIHLERFVLRHSDPTRHSSSTDIDRSIERTTLQDPARILRLTTSLVPWSMSNVDTGVCLSKWKLEYLQSKVGPETSISIHEGSSRYLQFYPQKNFIYRTCPFSELIEKITAGAHVYLRSLASESPFQKPANLWHDFPSLAEDLHIPRFLDDHLDLTNKMHSSVLRLSGDVAIWLHYDVMSNFLFQIRGSKTVILYPPTEAITMQFAPGSTTSPVPIADIEAAAQSSNSKCKTIRLHPGDVLFIPRFWLHATTPGSVVDHHQQQQEDRSSVAVNVFWRDLDLKTYAAGRDVYGSRDLGVYENGRKAVARIAQRLRDAALQPTEINGSNSDAEMPVAGQQQQQLHMLADWLRSGKTTGRLDLKNKIHGEVERLRRKFAHLPKDVGAFYLPRLADELLQLYGMSV